MFRTILLPVDGSDCMTVSVHYGAWLARSLQATVRLLFVQDIRIISDPIMPSGYFAIPGAAPVVPVEDDQRMEDLKSHGEDILETAAAMLRDDEVRVKKVNVAGIVEEAILDESRFADMIVMGQRGSFSAQSKESLGAVTDRVLHKTVKPAFVTPCDYREIKKILVAYDGSYKSSMALDKACDLCSLLQLPMVLLTVRDGSADYEEETRKQAERILETCSFPLDLQVLKGNRAEMIIEAAATAEADLIVMGVFGHTMIRELILGSTSKKVILNSNRPVMLLH